MRYLVALGLWSWTCLGLASPLRIGVAPSADAFVRSLAPGENYGRAGGLSVSGDQALNRLGRQMGTLDTFMRFDVAGAKVAFDQEFGTGAWLVVAATLELFEQGRPNNPIFNRGVGRFEVRWLANDDWLEGSGTPRSPAADGVCFSDEAVLLDPAHDVSLAIAWNTGQDGPLEVELATADEFLADIAAGGPVTLFLTAADPSIGFTFNSRNITSNRPTPVLWLAAEAAPYVIPEPTALSLLGLGVALGAWRRVRK